MAEQPGPDIIEKDLQLYHRADFAPSLAVDRNDRLDANLKIFRFIKDTGVDGASGLAAAAVLRRVKRKFDDRNHTFKRRWQPDVLHLCLQIRQAILESKAPFQTIGVGTIRQV